MPLRDHFRPPLDLITSWEGFHGVGRWSSSSNCESNFRPDMLPSRAYIPGRRSRSMSRHSRTTTLCRCPG